MTLEDDGVVRFPDAPTLRGTKHLLGLAQAAAAGYGAYVLFVIQMGNVKYFAPNDRTDPAFGAALRKAAASGVQILAMDCIVTPDSMALDRPRCRSIWRNVTELSRNSHRVVTCL